MEQGGDKVDDLGTAVEALLASESWERRLAEARESRRRILAEKQPKKEPLVLRPEWAAPVVAEPIPVPVPVVTASPRRSLLPAGLAVLAVLAGLGIWASRPPEPPPPAAEPAPVEQSSLSDILRPAPFSFARIPAIRIPSGYGAAPTVALEEGGARLYFAARGQPAASYDLPQAVPVTLPIPQQGRLPLLLAPPATEVEAYAFSLGRLRAAAGAQASLRIHLPADAPALEEPEGAELRTSRFTAAENVLRFYHAEDAEAARRAAEAVGARVADMTAYSPRPDEGVLELWLRELPPPG